MNGTFKEYYDDEQLKEEASYSKGELNGPFKDTIATGKWCCAPFQATPRWASNPRKSV